MDVFSMGLLMHEYLTGKLPHFDSEYGAAYEAVLDGQTLQLHPGLPPKMRSILSKMLLADPEERSSMEEVFREMGEFFGQEKPVIKPDEKPKKNPETPKVDGPMGKFFVTVGDL